MITLTKKPKRKQSPRCVHTEHRAREAIDRHSHFRGRVDGFQFEHRGAYSPCMVVSHLFT